MSANSQEITPSPRIARRRARTRERVLTEAAHLFAIHGIDGVTLAQVADAADISRGTLYSHFDSKQELVHEIYRPMFEHTAEQLETLSGLPPAEAIEAIIRIHLAAWQEFPGALSIAHQLQIASIEEHTPEEIPHLSKMMATFQQAADEGVLRAEPELALRIFTTIAVPLLQVLQEAQEPDELYVESMLRLLLNT